MPVLNWLFPYLKKNSELKNFITHHFNGSGITPGSVLPLYGNVDREMGTLRKFENGRVINNYIGGISGVCKVKKQATASTGTGLGAGALQ
jgi:hypothetical protein